MYEELSTTIRYGCTNSAKAHVSSQLSFLYVSLDRQVFDGIC